jgi:hypothetical protein
MEAISLAQEALPKVNLHATAVFSILNHFMRRNDRDARVIGKFTGVLMRLEQPVLYENANFPLILLFLASISNPLYLRRHFVRT